MLQFHPSAALPAPPAAAPGERRWTSGPPPELHRARASGDGAGLAIAACGNHHSSPPRYTSNFTPSTIGIPNARIATGINHASASNSSGAASTSPVVHCRGAARRSRDPRGKKAAARHGSECHERASLTGPSDPGSPVPTPRACGWRDRDSRRHSREGIRLGQELRRAAARLRAAPRVERDHRRRQREDRQRDVQSIRRWRLGLSTASHKAVHGSKSAAENVMLLRVIAIMRQPFGCDGTVVTRVRRG